MIAIDWNFCGRNTFVGEKDKYTLGQAKLYYQEYFKSHVGGRGATQVLACYLSISKHDQILVNNQGHKIALQ